MTNEEWAYLAGIIDGEGWIGIRYNSNTPRVELTIASTNSLLMDWLSNCFDSGKVVLSENSKQLYRWQVNSVHTLPVLKGVLPYLKLKTTQAELAIEYIEKCMAPYHGGRPAPEYKERRLEIVNIFKTINKRGV